jgi:hypothetical protein
VVDRYFESTVLTLSLISCVAAFCVDLGDGLTFNSTHFVPETHGLVHTDVTMSSGANMTLLETAVNNIGSAIGNPSDYVGHAHDLSTGVTDSNNPHVSTWETWSDAYMDGWIFSQTTGASSEMMLRADCATLIPTCGGSTISDAKEQPDNHDRPNGKPPLSHHPSIAPALGTGHSAVD